MVRRGDRALVLTHEGDDAGWIGERAEEVGFELELLSTSVSPLTYPNPTEFELIITLGSTASVYDESLDWIDREVALLQQAIKSDTPVLAVCFGSQTLSYALGGKVAPLQRPEIGWKTIHTDEPDIIPSGPWFQSHFDAFTTPPGARELARNDVGAQAFAFGRHLGVQFHPEIRYETLQQWTRLWMELFPEKIEAFGIDIDLLLEEMRQREAEARARGRWLFDRFLQHSEELSRLRA